MKNSILPALGLVGLLAILFYWSPDRNQLGAESISDTSPIQLAKAPSAQLPAEVETDPDWASGEFDWGPELTVSSEMLQEENSAAARDVGTSQDAPRWISSFEEVSPQRRGKFVSRKSPEHPVKLQIGEPASSDDLDETLGKSESREEFAQIGLADRAKPERHQNADNSVATTQQSFSSLKLARPAADVDPIVLEDSDGRQISLIPISILNPTGPTRKLPERVKSLTLPQLEQALLERRP